MKMARASQEDRECANQVASVLEALDKGFMPDCISAGGSDDFEWFDIDDHSQCRRVVERLIDIGTQGSMSRVTLGMDVLLDSALIDPDADTLEPHPSVLQAINSGWIALTSVGQIKQGDFVSFTLSDKPICATVRLVLDSGTDREEIVYNRKKNHYFNTSMALAGTSSHKAIYFRSAGGDF